MHKFTDKKFVMFVAHIYSGVQRHIQLFNGRLFGNANRIIGMVVVCLLYTFESYYACGSHTFYPFIVLTDDKSTYDFGALYM